MEKYNCEFIKIDITNSCNLSCPLCPNFYRRNKIKIPYKNISLQEFVNFINGFKVLPKGIGIGVNHEPLINDNVFDIIKFIDKKNIITTLLTNFTLSNKFKTETIVNSGIKDIFIGLDGIDQESYSKYRIGGNFNVVIDSIKEIQKYKKQNNLEFPKIKIIFIVFRHNEDLLEEAKALFDNLGVSVFFRRTDFCDGFEDWFPVKFKQENCEIKNNKINAICADPFTSVTIDAFGNVYPCCGDCAYDYSVGNIFKNDFETIWKCDKICDIRNFLKNKNSNINNVPCLNCPIYRQDNKTVALKVNI